MTRSAAVAAALGTTALVHVGLVPSHLREVPWLGIAFLAFAVSSAALAAVVAVRPTEPALRAAGWLCVSGLAAYAVSRTAGLPGHSDDVGDWLNPAGLLCLAAELYVAAGLRGSIHPRRRGPFCAMVIVFLVGLAPVASALPLHPVPASHQHPAAAAAGHQHAAGDRTVGLPLTAAAEDRMQAPGRRCPRGAAVRSYDVTAIAVDITLNRYGDHDPHGRAYVLTADLDRVRAEEATNAAARAGRGQPAVSLGLQGDALQPLTLRVRPGECLQIALHDQVPAEAVSLHLHGASLRVRGTDGPAVPGAPATTAGPGGTVEYEWSVPRSEPEGTHYFHSAGPDPATGRQQTSHGLYGAVVVEPKGSRWLDPLSGAQLSTGWAAVIDTPGRRAFREFALYYAEVGDETYQPLDRAGRPLPQAESLSGAYRPGGRAINYRSEPFLDRLALQQRTGRVDDSLAYSSYAFGDPATPVMRSYLGDPVTQRVIHAGSETAHVHHVHGGAVRWRRQPGEGATGSTSGLDKHPPLLPGPSERTDSQTLGPAESYDVADECGAGGCQQSAGDFLFHCHVAHHYFAGMWGIWRVYNTLQDGPHSTDELPPLLPLPGLEGDVAAGVTSSQLVGATVNGVTLTAADLPGWLAHTLPPAGAARGYDASVWDWQLRGGVAVGEPEDATSWPGHTGGRPGYRPPVLFDRRTGKPAYPLLRPHLGRRPPFAPGHSPAPYLDPSAGVDLPAPGADGPASLCPSGTRLRSLPVKAIELPIPMNRRENLVDPDGKLFVLQQQEAAVRADPDLRRPLTVRANAGQDCLDVTLTNGMSDATDPHHFSKVSLHVHFVQFDVQGSDGVDGGFNYEQTVRPYSGGPGLLGPARSGATALAVKAVPAVGSLLGVGLDRPDGFEVVQVAAVRGDTVLLRSPLRRDHARGEIVSPEFVRYRWYPDVQFGTTFFHDHVNAILGQPHGLYGALVVEPPDATYTDPRTGRPVEDGPLADITTAARTSVDVKGSFRELVTYLADDEPLTGTGRDTGGDLNLRVEPLRLRPDPRAPFRDGAAPPVTPTLRAYAGDPLVFRTLVGASNEVHTFHLDGHGVRPEPWSAGSAPAAGVPIGISERFDLAVPAAGGPRAQPGDYLFGNGRLGKLDGGSWGVLRVQPGPVAAGLRPLPGHVPSAVAPICPAGAPVTTAAVTAVSRPLAMLGGAKGLIFVRDGSDGAGRPLLLHVTSGACLQVTLTNATDRRLSLHADLLAQDPADAATGSNADHSVGPGGSRAYTMYADPELGPVTAQLRDGVDPVTTLRRGLYGAVVVLPAGARHDDDPDGVSSTVRTRDGHFYRDFTVFLQDGDAAIGTHRMPYTKTVDGVAAISYGAGGSRLPAPVLNAEAGDPVVLHVVVPASEQTQVFGVDGHSWPVEPGTDGTTHVSAVTVGGLQSVDLHLDGGAGGREHLAGDYAYGNARLPYAVAGMTGVLRVHPRIVPTSSGSAVRTAVVRWGWPFGGVLLMLLLVLRRHRLGEIRRSRSG